MKKNEAGIIVYDYGMRAVILGRNTESTDLRDGNYQLIRTAVLAGERNIEDVLVQAVKEIVGIDARFCQHKAKYENDDVIIRWYECTPLNHEIKATGQFNQAVWMPDSRVLSMLDKETLAILPYEVKRFFSG